MLLPLCGSGLGLYASVLHRGAADCSEAVALNIDWQLTLLPCQEWKQARGEGKSERMEAKLLSVVMVATRLRGNKINELFASVRVRWEYQHSTLLHLVVASEEVVKLAITFTAISQDLSHSSSSISSDRSPKYCFINCWFQGQEWTFSLNL